MGLLYNPTTFIYLWRGKGQNRQIVLNGKFLCKDLFYPFPARPCSIRQFVTKVSLLPLPFLSVWRVVGAVTLAGIVVHHDQLKQKPSSVALFFLHNSSLYYLSFSHKK